VSLVTIQCLTVTPIKLYRVQATLFVAFLISSRSVRLLTKMLMRDEFFSVLRARLKTVVGVNTSAWQK
jgi:hypothetical protein